MNYKNIYVFTCKFDPECRFVDVQGIVCKHFISSPKRCKNKYVLTFTIKGNKKMCSSNIITD